MLRRITRLIAGLLAAGLLLALAPSAHAAATYDITQVGDAKFVSVTSNGRELSEQTVASTNVPVTASIHIGIDDMAALKEGDVVTVGMSATTGSHFWPNLLTDANLPPYLADGSGRRMFDVRIRDTRTLLLVRTGEQAQGSFSCTYQVSYSVWGENGETASEWHIGKNSVYSFSNRPAVSQPCDWNSYQSRLAPNVSNGRIDLSMFTRNCRTIVDLAKGNSTAHLNTDSLVLWARIVPETGSIVKTRTWANQIWTQRAYDEDTPGVTYDDRLNAKYLSNASTDVTTLDTAKANLKPGSYVSQALSDGSWVIAVDFGSRLPGLDNSLQVLDEGDATTLKLLAKTGHIWQNAQFGVFLRFADESIPNRVKVEMQSTESAYQTTTLTTKPLDPAVGQGQSAIRYDPNGGDGDAFTKVGDSGTTATTAEAGVFLRKGHTFAGWNTKADGTGVAYQAGADVAYPAEGDTLTLYAQWEANAYKTEFRDWRGRTITSGTAKYGSTPTVPALSDTTWLADPDMNFDNVDGWRDDWWHGSLTFTKDGLTVNSRDTRANGKTVGANAAIHVEADADYSEANATNAAKSSGIGFNINNGNNSYQGWNACPNGRQCEVDAVLTAGLASSQTIEPWVQIANFNDYGTATVHHMQLTQVDPTTHNGIARDGYVFTGWDKDVTKPIEGDTVYTAQYRPAVYKIRFDANGGSGAMSEQSYTYDRKQALTASAFTREGYRFTGWNTRGDGKGKAFADKQAVTNLLAHDGATGVLYAQWERLPETALPWSGGTMTHNLTTILGGGLLILAIPFVLMRRRRLG